MQLGDETIHPHKKDTRNGKRLEGFVIYET